MHSDKWNWADIQEAIEWARSQGRTSKTRSVQTEHTRAAENAWDHGHCQICLWPIHDFEDSKQDEGFTLDGHKWVCAKCLHRFISLSKENRQNKPAEQ